ncbi:hypothetical protein ACLB1O_29965 [Escherichia coli]
MTLYSGDVSISDKQPGENMARKLKINPVIPECVADLKGYPLYIIVAYWGLKIIKRSQQRMLAVISLLHSNNL